MRAACASFPQRARSGFFNAGWLLPCVIPAVFAPSRALGNVLLGVYVLWALLAVRKADLRGLPTTLLLLLGGLVASAAVALPATVDPSKSLTSWLKFIVHLSALPLGVVVLRAMPQRLERLGSVAGVVAFASIAVFLTDLAVSATQPDFSPATQVRGLVAAYMAPFALVWLHRRSAAGWSGLLVAGIFALLIIALFAAESRTELIGLLVAAVTMWMLARKVWLVPLLTLFVAVPAIAIGTIRTTTFANISTTLSDWPRLFEIISSHRSTIWMQAVMNPPPDSLWGVGMNNIIYHGVLNVPGSGDVKHLHNFLLDAWYETGWVGLGFLVALLIYLAVMAWQGYRSATQDRRVWLRPLLASIVAVVATCMFDPSYRSHHFSMYMMFCFAPFVALAVTRAGSGSEDRRAG